MYVCTFLQELIRKKALEKVEAAVEDEKNSVKRQKTELIFKSKNQRMELECVEKMMRVAESVCNSLFFFS